MDCREHPRSTARLYALILGAVIIGVCGLTRAQQPAADPAAPTPASSSVARASALRTDAQEYVIARDDLLDVYVLDVPELSREYRVSPSGSMTLPLVPGPLMAAGLTPGQLSAAIGERLRTAGLVSNPQVVVTVKASRLHSVAVAGAVKKPQIYPVFGRTTVLDVVSQAEGLADDAGNTAIITRGDVATRSLRLESAENSSGGQASVPATVTVDLKRLLETGDPSLNLDVYPGDRVTVQRAGIVYVVGAVNRAGGFPLTDDAEEMTVLKAIALAQDLKSTAIRQKAAIIRKNPQASGGREEIPVDLKKVLAGRAPDYPMQPNDILFVPDSTGKKALRRAAEAAIQITAGVIIWRR